MQTIPECVFINTATTDLVSWSPIIQIFLILKIFTLFVGIYKIYSYRTCVTCIPFSLYQNIENNMHNKIFEPWLVESQYLREIPHI